MMTKAKKFLKRGMALFCVLIILSGNAFASRVSVNTAIPLGNIKDTASAMKAVQAQAEEMAVHGMLQNIGDARYLGRFTEYALAHSGAEWVDGNALNIDAARVERIRAKLEPAKFQDFLDTEMEKRDWEPFGRESMNIVAEFQMGESDIVITIEPDVKNITSVNTILVRTPFYDLSFRPLDLRSDLNERLTIGLKDISETLNPLIEVSISKENLAGYLTLFLTSAEGDLERMAIVNETTSEEIISFYNNVTSQVGGRIFTPGVYEPVNNGKRFNDLEGLSQERQDAIEQLASMNIVSGYPDGGFHPNASLNRGQFVKIIINAVTKPDNSLKPQYSDVTSNMYYYHHAATAAALKYMGGYGDKMFHGERTLNKAQICAVMGRILMQEHYEASRPLFWLGKYDDAIPDSVQDLRDSVAILNRLGILDYSSRHFGAEEPVSRGETMELMCRMLSYLNN